jgi:hypothetical protein
MRIIYSNHASRFLNIKHCVCSYCTGSIKLKYGLNIPKNWQDENSWWVIKYWKYRYIRLSGIGYWLLTPIRWLERIVE